MKYIFALFILICITLFNLSPFGFKILAGFDHAQGGTLVFVPNANELVAGNGAFTSPTATTPRTYQWLIHESQLTALVGKNLTAITYRLPTSATGPWPTTDVTYSDYDIYLSGSVSPENRSLAFAQNVVGTQTQVRSGQLFIPANSFTSGGNPNAFGLDITFNQPWLYSGGHLLIEMRHNGVSGTSSRSNDAITASGGPPYGTLVSGVWASGYSATSGYQGNFAILRISGESSGPEPNYGDNGQTGDNLYFFANSTAGASGSPSQPTYQWRTAGADSNTLIVNRTLATPLGTGTLDDGRFDIGGQLPAGHSIRFFGTNYSDFYVGTNGIVGFGTFTPGGGNWNPPNTGLPQGNITNALFPLWIDLNFGSGTGPATNRLWYEITPTEVIISYENAYVFGGIATTFVSFQVIISHSASPTQNSRVIYQYSEDLSGADFISRYNANTLRQHLSGLQGSNDAQQVMQYRFRDAGGTVLTEGPLFGSNLAVAFGPDNTALPVDLISFSSAVDANNVTLNWTTGWEENNARFDIQRRTYNSESQWKTVGSVAGNGTVYEERHYSFTDKNLNSGVYEYRLVQYDYDGNSNADFNLNQAVEVGVPSSFALKQNYPNPFNPVTKIDFQIPVEGLVTLSVFDMAGREVATLVNETLTAGYYSYEFNASNLSSGAYFYRLVSNNNIQTKRMVVVK